MDTHDDEVGRQAQSPQESTHILTEIREEPRKLRPVIFAAAIGTFVEFYDFALYGLLATTISIVFFLAGNPTVVLLSTFAIFGVDFVVRPLGSLFWGPLGDRIGRQRTLTATIIWQGPRV